jgi:hypothetical protein
MQAQTNPITAVTGTNQAQNLFLDKPFADVDAIIFDATADISSTVQWLSGPCKDSNWSGTFTTEREGKTHKIRLRSGTIATNNAD